MKEILFMLLLMLILINSGCAGIEGVKRGEDMVADSDLESPINNSGCGVDIEIVEEGENMIPNFDFDLESYLGKNITVFGEVVNIAKHNTQNYNNLETLESRNGARIRFKPRGDRNIKPGNIYVVRGTVIKDREEICDSEPCDYEIFLLEVGP